MLNIFHSAWYGNGTAGTLSTISKAHHKLIFGLARFFALAGKIYK